MYQQARKCKACRDPDGPEHWAAGAMRKGDSLVQAGTAQSLPFYELRKDLFIGYIGIRVCEQLAQNLEAVFLAACMRIAKDTVRAY